MELKIPKKLLGSDYRKETWKNSQKIISKLEKALPITSAYIMGSFTTKKKRPNDIDFIILLQTKEKPKSKWSVDLVIAPDNEHGDLVLKDTKEWMKQKYGSKKSAVIRLK
jgi:predicted nucleotidyltransferase